MSRENPPPTIVDLADRLYHGMNRAIIRRLREAGYGEIRMVHAAVFETMGRGARISTMAARVGITKQSMGELVAYLERHGYVEKAPDPEDARASIVRVTRRGRNAVAVAQRAIDDMTARWSAVASERQITAAARVLARIADDIEAFADE